MQGEKEPTAKDQVSVGLMADPGLPMVLAQKLAQVLPKLLGAKTDDEVEWVVKAEEYPLPLDADGFVQLTASSSILRQDRGWDYMVYVTELPKYLVNEPLVAILNTTYGAGVIVVPALGLGGTRPLRRFLLQMVSTLHVGASDHGRPRGHCRSWRYLRTQLLRALGFTPISVATGFTERSDPGTRRTDSSRNVGSYFFLLLAVI